jgi:hypothetical protein
MKKFSIKPGFEFIFSLSLIVVLGLPPVLMAQNNRDKDMDINIANGDTTVNGKSIKELSVKQHQEALNTLSHLQAMPAAIDKGDHHLQQTYSYKQTDSIVDRPMFGPRKGGPGKMFNPHNMRFERRNTQNLDYISTDGEGISTHVRFHISEISNDDLKKMPYVEGGKFELSDLNIVPQFATGKTLLMFTLPAKAVAEVKLTDSEGKILWTEKTTTVNFSKSFELGLNGIYYLQVKQGRNIAIKKITKEE